MRKSPDDSTESLAPVSITAAAAAFPPVIAQHVVGAGQTLTVYVQWSGVGSAPATITLQAATTAPLELAAYRVA